MVERRFSKVVVVILIILAVVISVFPFVWMLANSFMSESQIFAIPLKFWPDKLFKKGMWENYIEAFSNFSFGRYTWNSFFVSFLAALGQIIVCPMAAFAFAKMRFHGRKAIYTLLLMTLMIPVQVIIIPEYYLMMKLGWLNSYLPLIIPSFLAGAFGTFMFIAVFEAIPSVLLDAAVIDGASAYKILWRVYFPQATASVATLFIIAFMNNWNDLLRPLLYVIKPSLFTVTMGLTRFQNQYTTKWGLILTGSVISVLPLIVVYIFCQRYIIENQMSSGVKG
ncbi:MAG: carbohydrate ABC transporter permease [Spirochaetales bacterium]|nr:carbohydrate ABC transporter permease [Spirochaetales bacterium]